MVDYKEKLIIAVQDFPALCDHTRKDLDNETWISIYYNQTFIKYDSFSLCKKLRLHFEARFPATVWTPECIDEQIMSFVATDINLWFLT